MLPGFPQLPDPSKAEEYLEPFVMGTVIFPEEYMGKMITLCQVSETGRRTDNRQTDRQNRQTKKQTEKHHFICFEEYMERRTRLCQMRGTQVVGETG